MTGQLLLKKKKSQNPHVHQPSVSHPYGTRARAPAKTHKLRSADTHTHTHGCANIHTHTPPHSSKVHLSRWQLDSCWGGVCQAESLAYLVGARTSWETFWHTEAAEPSCMCLCLCMHVHVNAQLFKTPSSTIARSSPSSVSACAWQGQTWQGAARFVRLPVNMKSAFCSRLYLSTFPLLPFLSQLFTLWYLQSVSPRRLEGMYCKLFLANSPEAESTGNLSRQWCNWVFLWQRKIHGESDSRSTHCRKGHMSGRFGGKTVHFLSACIYFARRLSNHTSPGSFSALTVSRFLAKRAHVLLPSSADAGSSQPLLFSLPFFVNLLTLSFLHFPSAFLFFTAAWWI